MMVALLPLVGCTSSRDVSSDIHYQIGFAPGQFYRLMAPTTLFALNSDGATRLLDIDAWASQHLPRCGTRRQWHPILAAQTRKVAYQTIR